MHKALAVAAATVLLGAGASARAQPSSAEQRFRELYKELVETNTSLSAGSCTLAAERMAARLKASGYTDEELHLFTAPGHPKEGGLNGAQWLTQNRRDLIDAAFAINEGARGELDAGGHRVALEVQAGEKTSQNYRLEVTNSGGHSSLPVKDNAIYRLAGALKKIEAYTFPPQFTDANRAYFTGMAKIQAAQGEAAVASAMQAFVRDPADAQAIELVSAKDPGWNATLRTTCVATMLEAGHATNALPQRARANINCRIFPGVTQ